MIGLTGTEDNLKKITKAYGVYVKFSEEDEITKEYIVDHSMFTFLVGLDGKILNYYGHDVMAEDMTELVLERFREHQQQQNKN